jgi:hypothetical protein
MRIENASRVLILPFTITHGKTSSTIASSTFQSWIIIIILYSRGHVEENGIFHLFLKKDSPFSIIFIFLLWIFLWRISTKWYHYCWNCQGTVLWAIWTFMFIYASELFLIVWNFALLQNLKKDFSKINFSKREKSKIYIYKIYKIWKKF